MVLTGYTGEFASLDLFLVVFIDSLQGFNVDLMKILLFVVCSGQDIFVSVKLLDLSSIHYSRIFGDPLGMYKNYLIGFTLNNQYTMNILTIVVVGAA